MPHDATGAVLAFCAHQNDHPALLVIVNSTLPSNLRATFELASRPGRAP